MSENYSLDIRVKNLDEKFKLLMDEAEKRNGQRFDAQQEAVATAMVAQEKAVLAAMAAAEKAVAKAEIASEKRFESVNEFRKTLSDQTQTFITRAEYASQHASVIEKVDAAATRVGITERLIGELRERGTTGADAMGRSISIVAVLVSLGTLMYLISTHVGH
jgi:hypothetical protein